MSLARRFFRRALRGVRSLPEPDGRGDGLDAFVALEKEGLEGEDFVG
jgi:hypothetical protein